MHDMTNRRQLAALCAAAGMTLGAAGCGSAGGSSDKAGGTGEPVVLELATVNGDLAYIPQAQAFVEAVEELSDGYLKIEVVSEVGQFEPDAEAQVVKGVAADDYDLGVVGTQVFDTLGVTSFQALTAPMLVDNYALEKAIITSGVTDEMMQALGPAGVTGVAVLAGNKRLPAAVEAPLGGPADWQGLSFGTYDGELLFDIVRALGASPAAKFGAARDQGLREGTLDGFETSTFTYQQNSLQLLAPYLTTNVALWPQILAVVASPALDDQLTDEQRGWLDQAADQVVDGTADLADVDAAALADACTAGARLRQATAAEVADLEDAFEPVYADLRSDPATAGFLDEIEAMKAATLAEPAMSNPSPCGSIPPAADDDGEPATTPRYLNGVYRYTLTKQDAIDAGEGDDPEYPLTQTWWLENGQMKGSGGWTGEYWVQGDLFFIVPESGTPIPFTFSRDDEGNLTLSPAEPIEPGDAFLMSGAPWIKIG